MHKDEVVGLFWACESVEHKVYGLLKVDEDNRATLILYDWPIPNVGIGQIMNNRYSEYSISSIIGQLENGKWVVLRDTNYAGYHVHGLEKFTFTVEFITYDIDDPLNLMYNKVSFKFTNIDQLIGEKIVNRDYDTVRNRLTQVKIGDPISSSYDIDGGASITITHNYSFNYNQQTTSIENSTYIEFSFPMLVDDSSLLNHYLMPFMLYMSYLAGEYIALEDISLIRESSNKDKEYYPTIHRLINKPPSIVNEHPLNLRGMKKEEFGAIFLRFRSIYESNPLIFNLIVLQTQRSSIVLEYKFITLVGALDSIVYDLIENSRYIAKGDYAEKVVKPIEEYLKSFEIIENNPGLCDRVMEQIRNANIKNFKPMLEVAIEKHKTILPEQVVLKKDIMVSNICNFRADYVHFRKVKAKQDTEYYSEFSNTYRYVYCLVDAIIYSKIGISDSYAKQLIESKYKWLIAYLSKL